MVAMGHVLDRVIGSDAAGIVKRVGKEVSRLKVGDRVVVLTRAAMRTTVRVDERLPQKIPDNMSMASASTLPTVFVTAYQVLIETARLQKGETILIHSAAGGKSILTPLFTPRTARLFPEVVKFEANIYGL
jgi:NADPH:quinone reductase-like Zn-dependent oxidoreductase